jgi:hypothetical protein
LQASGFPLDSLPKNWPALPKEAKEAESEITYGLYSLAGFKDHSDLPFIRDLISWQVSHRLEYTYPNLLLVLGLMPDVKNLPLIAAMQHAIRAGDVVRALRDYRYPETLPLLARLLEGASPENSREALHYLKQIVGIDLGPNPQAWLDWYAQREKGHHD